MFKGNDNLGGGTDGAFFLNAIIPRKSPVDNLFYLPGFLQNAVSDNWRLEKDLTEDASLLSSQETTLTNASQCLP